ncbi:MAG: transcription-repair coupling factor [bacterium]|nr:MAG: transcription-repair coupling factor [bacterium]
MFPPASLLDDLEKSGTGAVSGLPAQATALLAARLPDAGRLVVITPDTDSARRFSQDLAVFLQTPRTHYMPPSESEPYELLASDIDISSMRISALLAMGGGTGPVVLPSTALMQPVPTPGRLARWVMRLRRGQSLDRDLLLRQLAAMEYRRESVAAQVGDMAVRGGILDVFSPPLKHPLRIEMWDDQIHSIRTFDAQTQRSVEKLQECTILPVTELLLDPGEREDAAQRLRDHLVSTGMAAKERESALALLEERTDFPGLGLLLPVLSGERSYPQDHLAHDRLLLLCEPEEIASVLSRYWTEAGERRRRAFPAPGMIYRDPAAVQKGLAGRKRILAGIFDRQGATPVPCRHPLPSTIPASRPDRIAELARLLGEDKDENVVLMLRSDSAAQRLESIITDMGVRCRRAGTFTEALHGKGVGIVTGNLSGGFHLPEESLRVISDADLFGPAAERKPSRVSMPEWELPIGSLMEGDIVVHIDHGIGRYVGLRQLSVAGSVDDFLQLTYAEGDSLYVPVWQMNRVQRYRSGSQAAPPLSRLGSASWNRAKDRIRRSLRLMAGDLLRVSAARQSLKGHAFPPPDALFREFEMSFPWTETPDQERTISDVIQDMMSPAPMDRLVCGDVGFGKTEVALRAAFLAALEGKQTAVLVPTTVLAQQHYQTFSERLRQFPVSVGLMSRFVSPAGQKAVLASLASGALDIVIGTHRLLSSDVSFRDLGLVVIDEEHRFGVRHKEKLKRIRETVDVLTLSATPIPRTLFQAFSGLRRMSLIHTPPADRKAVHTEIRYFDEDLIRDAITREMDREGQVYFVHNRVRSIEAVRSMVARLVPHARVGVAHGQMGERQLEEVMIRFLNREYDVLVTTAIIESGLDIANANTLIINRADRFGLAQLYQLRGRVGRSPARAFAYMLIPPEGAMPAKARQRLQSLRELSALGSGFRLASYDLEMRGAGNLLGEEQSGRIDAVGLELYSQLLEQAVRGATGQQVAVEVEPSVTLPLPAYLPETYLPDVGERLTLYKRLASAGDTETLASLMEETLDRFGRFPREVNGLFLRMEVQVAARSMSIERIDAAGPYMLVVFHPQAKVSPDALVALLASDRRLGFVPPTTLRLDVSGFGSPRDRVAYLMDVLRSL